MKRCGLPCHLPGQTLQAEEIKAAEAQLVQSVDVCKMTVEAELLFPPGCPTRSPARRAPTSAGTLALKVGTERVLWMRSSDCLQEAESLRESERAQLEAQLAQQAACLR